MRIDGSDWFAFVLLVALAAVGAACIMVAVALLVALLRQEHEEKHEQRNEELDLQEEQRIAVAVAQALVIQHFYDNDHG